MHLGHIVGNGTVKPEPGKIEVVQNFQSHKSRKKLGHSRLLQNDLFLFFSTDAVPVPAKSNSSKIMWNQ